MEDELLKELESLIDDKPSNKRTHFWEISHWKKYYPKPIFWILLFILITILSPVLLIFSISLFIYQSKVKKKDFQSNARSVAPLFITSLLFTSLPIGLFNTPDEQIGTENIVEYVAQGNDLEKYIEEYVAEELEEYTAQPPNEEQEEFEEPPAIFSEVQRHDTFNGFGTQIIGERATAYVERSELTDEALLEFFNESIRDHDYNWFTLKFNDGTGYFFGGSGNHFHHALLDEMGRNYQTLDYIGSIFETHIQRRKRINVPNFSTVTEALQWANENQMELMLAYIDDRNISRDEIYNYLHSPIVEAWDDLFEGDTTLRIFI